MFAEGRNEVVAEDIAQCSGVESGGAAAGAGGAAACSLHRAHRCVLFEVSLRGRAPHMRQAWSKHEQRTHDVVSSMRVHARALTQQSGSSWFLRATYLARHGEGASARCVDDRSTRRQSLVGSLS